MHDLNEFFASLSFQGRKTETIANDSNRCFEEKRSGSLGGKAEIE